MGLLADIQGECHTRRDRLTDLLSQVTEDERDELLAALHDRSISTSAIVKVLKRRGVTTSMDSIYNLRRRLRDESA